MDNILVLDEIVDKETGGNVKDVYPKGDAVVFDI